MILAPLFRALARLLPDRRGNVALITGLTIVPLVFAIGFGIDYSRAMRLRTKLNAAADAAALAAVTAPMMQSTATAARNAAINMFNSQVANLPGLVYDSTTDLDVTVNTSGTLNNGRTVVVTYRAKSQNVFAYILGAPTLPVNGSTQSDATKAPYINFYLVLDTSPSMLLPDTSDGLNKVRTKTSTSHLTNGCAFACHVQNPHGDNIYVQNSSGQDIYLDTSGNWWAVTSVSNNKIYAKNASNQTIQVGTTTTGQYADGYWLTQNYDKLWGGSPLELRLDAEEAAAKDLIPFATTMASNNHVTYKLQMFTFDYQAPKTLTSTMADVSTLTTASVPDLNSRQVNWYSNNCITSSNCISDQSTEFLTMLNSMNTTMPTPGDGSTASTPQEVMFIITDGVVDETIGGSRRTRELATQHNTVCTAIKTKGIRIAILYTEYLPESLTGDSWSQSAVAPYLGNVEGALKNCASTGSDGIPLFYKVTSDQSISDALTALFALTVQTAHLTR